MAPAAAVLAVVAVAFGGSQFISEEDGAQPSDAEGSPSGTASSPCAEQWRTTRESLVAAGVPDGEARRQADLGRLECEGVAEQLSVESPAPLACENPTDSLDPANKSGQLVFFSCLSDVGTLNSQPRAVEELGRAISSARDGVAERIEGALVAYFEGPNTDQKRAGYMTAVPTPIKNPIDEVRVTGTTATVSFTSAVEAVGSLPTAAGDAFVAELRSNVLQFAEVDTLQLAIGDSCGRFWSLLQSTCTDVKE